jgi:hypothetical protein
VSSIIKVCTLALVATALFFVGCGSSNSNSNQLTQAQAQQLSSDTFADAVAALQDVAGQAGGLDSDHKSSPLVALSKGKKTSMAVDPDGIVCSGFNCAITSVVYNCIDGGTITINGSTSASASSGSLDLTLTPAGCSDGTLVINGNPSITMDAQATDNGTTTTATATIDGDISFSPVHAGQFPSGSCTSNLSLNVAISNSAGSLVTCSVSGSMCGQTVSITSCP